MNRSALILSCVSVLLALGVVFLGYKLGGGPLQQPAAQTSWSAENQRTLANKLKSQGLTNEAIEAYEHYALTAQLDPKQLANVSYAIGKLYMDSGQYEKALGWFYRTEIADPQTPLKAELGSKVINCLERSGKYNAAEYALGRRTSINKTDRKTGTQVVAEVAGEKIYIEDIHEAIDSMPEWMRKQFESRERKAEFLRKYVADELLHRKAIKLEFDKDPAVRKQMKKVEREMLVNKVVEQELKDKITIEKADLQNYFKAHQDRYLQKAAVKVSLIKAGLKEVADKIMEELSGGKDFHDMARSISLDNATAANGGRYTRWVRKGEDDLGIGNVKKVSEALFAAETGTITQPIEAGGYYYIFKIDKKRAAKMPSFQEVAERVQNDYYMEKLKAAYQKLLDQILSSSEVKIHPEVFTGETSS